MHGMPVLSRCIHCQQMWIQPRLWVKLTSSRGIFPFFPPVSFVRAVHVNECAYLHVHKRRLGVLARNTFGCRGNAGGVGNNKLAVCRASRWVFWFFFFFFFPPSFIHSFIYLRRQNGDRIPPAARGQRRRAAAAYKEQGDGENPHLYYCKWDFCGRLCSSERGVCCRSYSRASRPAPYGCGHRRVRGVGEGQGEGCEARGHGAGRVAAPRRWRSHGWSAGKCRRSAWHSLGVMTSSRTNPEITTASPPLLASPRLNGFSSFGTTISCNPLHSSPSLRVREAAVCVCAHPQLEALNWEKQQRPRFLSARCYNPR